MLGAFSPDSDVDWAALPVVPRNFYLRPTVEVAQALLGQALVHQQPEGLTVGLIVETEAYLVGDPGSHAWRGRTARNAPMFGPPGTIYVYRIYGVHWCVNLVTQPEGVPEAVLIRALEPVAGLELMRQRRGVDRLEELCGGPARLTEALGISEANNWGDATTPPLWVADTGQRVRKVGAGTRVGLPRGRGHEAVLRFGVAGSRFLSRRFAG